MVNFAIIIKFIDDHINMAEKKEFLQDKKPVTFVDLFAGAGGISCQSFSLSGRRKRFDKRDGLFNHYLKVIRALRPKYFVIEKSLLTKDNGRFKIESNCHIENSKFAA